MRYPFPKSMLVTLKITSIQRMEGSRLTDVLIINDQGEILKSIEYDFEGKPNLEATCIYNSAKGRIKKRYVLIRKRPKISVIIIMKKDSW